MEDEKVVAFLTELTALSRKYRIEICGCGCCGSPALQELDDMDETLLRYSVIVKNQQYQDRKWNEYECLEFDDEQKEGKRLSGNVGNEAEYVRLLCADTAIEDE